MFTGSYNGKQYHADDLASILQRAQSSGVQKIIITGCSADESKRALEMATSLSSPLLPLYTTVGVHPTSCGEYKDGVEAVEAKLVESIEAGLATGKLAAIGNS